MKRLLIPLLLTLLILSGFGQQDLRDIPTNKAAGTDSDYAWEANRMALVAQDSTVHLDSIGVIVQAYDADLTTYAGITPSANVQSLMSAADYAAMRTLLDLEGGTDFYSISAADAAFEPISAATTAELDAVPLILDDTTNFKTAYTHSQNNTQAHTDYLLNSGNDIMAGVLTADGFTLGENENVTFGAQTLDHNATDFVFSDEVTVPDDAYAAGWNGDLGVPTKNAVYDKVETIAADSSRKTMTMDSLIALTDTIRVKSPMKIESTGALIVSSIDPDALDLSMTTDGTLNAGTDSLVYFEFATGLPAKALFPAASGAPATADISDVSVTQTELEELETIGATTISANQWAALGGIAETLGSAELDLLDGETDLASQAELDAVAALVDSEAEIEAITGAYFGSSKVVTSGYIWVADGTDFESVAMSGDVAIATGGATTIQTDAVDAAMINTDAVTMDAIDADGDFEDLTGKWHTTGEFSGGILDTIITDSTALPTKFHYGGVIYITGATLLTLDAIADGMSFTVITIGAIVVDVDPNASDLVILDGTAGSDGEHIENTSTTGDLAVFTYYNTTGWYAASGSNDGDLWGIP